MAKKWRAAPAAELLDESDEEIDVVGEGRGRSPAPAATAPGPSPRDPEPTLLYNGKLRSYHHYSLKTLKRSPRPRLHRESTMAETRDTATYRFMLLRY